jgi:hypothetical protein
MSATLAAAMYQSILGARAQSRLAPEDSLLSLFGRFSKDSTTFQGEQEYTSSREGMRQ